MSTSPQPLSYQERVAEEIEHYRDVEEVHDLPGIFHYWSNTYLVPMLETLGFQNSHQFFLQYAAMVCRNKRGSLCRFISVGAGNGEVEIALVASLKAMGHTHFVMECLDVNPHMLARGRQMAQEQHVENLMRFTEADINKWDPQETYDLVIAYHSLHHFVYLEKLFASIHACLAEDGYFVTHDMIGRNGHMRWPEALEVVDELWRELPSKYKYNHQLKCLQLEFENWDCSKEGFEGIRAQDILPLLLETFHFHLFVGWGGIIDIFTDRGFGPNFDPRAEEDRAFIDAVHALNEEKIIDGSIKPTQMIAAMTKQAVDHPLLYKGLTPQHCLRTPDA